jgi:predicted RecB family nuclease
VAWVFLTEGADPQVVYSASDLAAAARCEYALLRSFDALLGWGPRTGADDELLARTATLGGEHERRHLDELRDSADTVVIGKPKYTVAGLTAAAAATRSAIDRRAGVVYQAAMFDGRFVGFADFLILAGDRYRLRDTKLARSVKVEALLQLAAYADTLARGGVPVADDVELVLGDGTVAAYRVEDLLPVYLPRRAALERLLDEHRAGGRPVRWDDVHVRACFHCQECSREVRAHDDLLLVAGMRVSQRARLLDAGITTVHDLAAHDGAVPELPSRTVKALVAQARLQVADRVVENGSAKPPYEVVDAQPLMVLPDADKGDLFFDFEGDPLWTLNGREWGLEYLWGVLTVTDEFTPYWAHDRPSERQALVDFLTLVRKRLKKHPGMHVYHYAAYEKSTLLRLAGRYGVGENEVDDLLRNGVLVDLYPLERPRRHRELQHQVARTAVHGQRAARRRGDHRDRLDHAVRPLLRAARRGHGRRGGDGAQGDRGLQPLRLPIHATAARLADGQGHRVGGATPRAATHPGRRGAGPGRRGRRHRAAPAELRR